MSKLQHKLLKYKLFNYLLYWQESINSRLTVTMSYPFLLTNAFSAAVGMEGVDPREPPGPFHNQKIFFLFHLKSGIKTIASQQKKSSQVMTICLDKLSVCWSFWPDT